jgi:hypothetical protein
MCDGSRSHGFSRRMFLRGAGASAATLLGHRIAFAQQETPIRDLRQMCVDVDVFDNAGPLAQIPQGAAAAPAAVPRAVMKAVMQEIEGKEWFEDVVTPTDLDANALISSAPAFGPPDEHPPLAARAAALTRWPTLDLRVAFLDERDPSRVDTVLQTIQEWSNACGIKFTRVSSNKKAEIRVDFRPDFNVSLVGEASASGSLANLGLPRASMNLALTNIRYDRFLILHEFGHALGLVHEHQQPNSNLKFNDSVYAYFKLHGRLDRAIVDSDILFRYNVAKLFKTGVYDPLSIMAYVIPKSCLIEGDEIGERFDLSAGDKSFMSDVKMYGPSRSGTGNVTPVPKVDEIQVLASDGTPKIGAITKAGGQADFEFTVPATRSGTAHTIGTKGTTQVMLRLFGPNDPTREVPVKPGIDEGTPDLVNHVLRLKLDAGKYTVRATHLSKGGGGNFETYLMEGRQNIRLGRR